uniref:Haloacid dehalogenase-like hydrolase-like protein n=1 Tax=Angomonas deanei TaxID=59799 RepID=C6K3S7_9TRYP|nr:haloacid dehalogenase-like hydrolase-like protein [Angomonas deanei]
MPQKIKAVFSDLDGTLYNAQHTVSQRTFKAVKALQDKGIPFIMATGRPFPDVFANLETTGLKPDFIITSNGSRVHDAMHDHVFGCDVNPESVERFFQLSMHLTDDGVVDASAPARSIQLNLNYEDRWLTNQCTDEVRAMYHPSLNYEQVDPTTFSAATLSGTHSMYAWGKHEDLLCVKKYIERELPDVTCAFPLPHILDCFPAGNHKAVAVQKVCDELGIDMKETIAFGDGMNDVQMLHGVGQGYVMDNAAPMVKEAMEGLPVIGTNNDDAVAVKLEELLAKGAF